MLASIIFSPAVAISNSTFAEGSNGRQEKTLFRKAVGLVLAVSIPAGIVFYFFSSYFFLLFGPAYSAGGVGNLQWLALSAPLVSINYVYFSYLRVAKFTRQYIVVTLVVAAISIGIPMVLMRQNGLEISGISWLISQAVVVCLAVFDIRKRVFTAKSGVEA
jgi:O-antigen/teichoic acid export membrane protein